MIPVFQLRLKHKRLLKEAAGGDIAYIVLSHSHGDHIGGLKFWQAEYPDAKVIVHERFSEGQRYLKDLEPKSCNPKFKRSNTGMKHNLLILVMLLSRKYSPFKRIHLA